MEEMRMGFFEYKVTYFDEFAEGTEYGALETTYGVTHAASFNEAMENINRYYDNIDTVTIQGLEPSSCYDFKYDPCILKIKCKDKKKE